LKNAAAVMLFLLFGISTAAQETTPEVMPDSPFAAAADYSRIHSGHALVVYFNGQLVFEEYQNGYDGTKLHLLTSGTKSFVCAIAAAAVDEGLLVLDEPVSDTLTEWQDDLEKKHITLRQVLTQTDGITGGAEMLQDQFTKDKVEMALRLPLAAPVGERFIYGPSHFFVFAEVLRRKLTDENVLQYFYRRVLQPIGLTNIFMGRDDSGNPDFAAGGATTAQEWAKYGQLILNGGTWEGEEIIPEDGLRECFTGTAANPYYGMGFWLQYDLENFVPLEIMAIQSPEPGVPEGIDLGETQPEVIIAAGQGRQRLYIIPALGMVVVRFGQDDETFDDAELLRLLTLHVP
jgi:CubicO group peptidase (beta-lactamase class C family)